MDTGKVQAPVANKSGRAEWIERETGKKGKEGKGGGQRQAPKEEGEDAKAG